MFTRLIKQTISFLLKLMPSDDEEALEEEHLKWKYDKKVIIFWISQIVFWDGEAVE